MLAGYLNQTVDYSQFHSFSAYHDPSYNTDATLNARVSYRQKKVYTQSGEEVMSFCHVTVAEEIGYNDRITLSDGVKRIPLRIRHARGADGTLHHSEVDL